MNCPNCRKAELVEVRKDIRYAEAGFPNVTLRDILVERCPDCGDVLVNIPQMERLHSLLEALTINTKKDMLVVALRHAHTGWMVDKSINLSPQQNLPD